MWREHASGWRRMCYRRIRPSWLQFQLASKVRSDQATISSSLSCHCMYPATGLLITSASTQTFCGQAVYFCRCGKRWWAPVAWRWVQGLS
eukprot:COSAG06_NODE_1079_length_10793_cov_2.779596_13_plen_90_part_00